MRDGHLTSPEIEAHARRALDPASALAASDHLQECEQCRLLFASVLGQREITAVPYEELAAFLDDQLDPFARRVVAQKFAASPAARAELRDLENFKVEQKRFARRGSNLSAWSWPLAAAALIGAAGLWWMTQSKQSAENYAIGLPPFMRELQIKPSVLAGEAAREAKFHLLRPVATAVENGTPRFQWNAYPTATAYRLSIALAEGDEVLLSKVIGSDQQSWRPEAPLAREKTYRWEIEALRGDEVLAKAPNPPEADARFRVISEQAANEVVQARARLGDSHLELGLAYARAGLVHEAQEEFDLLKKENPNSSAGEKLRAALTTLH